MRPIETDRTNMVFSGEGCIDLPAVVSQKDENGRRYIESCWELTPEEIQKVQETGRIYLSVLGGQPPVLLSVEPIVLLPEVFPKQDAEKSGDADAE